MSKKILLKPLEKNQLDDLTDALVNAMKYSDASVMYPEVESGEPNDGVNPEWFMPIYNGTNSFSELSAIHMYVTQETKFEEIGELMLGIGLTEMKHFGKIGEFIHAIGGEVDQTYSNKESEVGEDVNEALALAIRGEEETIEFYNKLFEKISKLEETKTIKIALQLISKLRADENVHLNLLNKKLKERNERQGD